MHIRSFKNVFQSARIAHLCNDNDIHHQCKACLYLSHCNNFTFCCSSFIMKATYKYFSQVFEKYDELNASVQENVTSIRVVKAFVREKHEVGKFRKQPTMFTDSLLRLKMQW